MARGKVFDADGVALTAQSAHRAGLTIRYFREVENERPIPFTETIVYADANIVVADKPHFLPVTPKGAYVEQTLLARLVNRLGNRQLAPLHRIDRCTAGLVLFSANAANRGKYHALFRHRQISKTYQAMAPSLPSVAFPFVYRSRLIAGEPFFRMREVPGAPNTETRIDVLERGHVSWRYQLQPVTGKKHQLRVHMAALGAAIQNDDFYPLLVMRAADDYGRPLKLIATELAFVDPISGKPLQFKSGADIHRRRHKLRSQASALRSS
jgi:tRNA pseudouridine32 synthase/23S rRNA pseudouridine746 synthase